jgi:hypothetical protein
MQFISKLINGYPLLGLQLMLNVLFSFKLFDIFGFILLQYGNNFPYFYFEEAYIVPYNYYQCQVFYNSTIPIRSAHEVLILCFYK